MRQVGVLAAACLVALEETPARLADDHANARSSWPRGWRGFPAFRSTREESQTNIVVFDVSGTGLARAEISARLKERGVLINGINSRCMRLVTHMDVTAADCERALGQLEEAVAR